ncbi:MAG: hypothetical protein KGL39_54820 [Patescibacteria group bacterium]|nr:hypothetical protein [Patescibacteria group bacterium]
MAEASVRIGAYVVSTMAETTANNWFLPAEVARELGLPAQAVLRLMDAGRLSVLRLPGQRPRIRLSDARALLEQSTVPASEA